MNNNNCKNKIILSTAERLYIKDCIVEIDKLIKSNVIDLQTYFKFHSYLHAMSKIDNHMHNQFVNLINNPMHTFSEPPKE